MGLEPDRIPLMREAFGRYRYPLADFTPKEIAIHMDGLSVQQSELFHRYGRKFKLPKGWDQGCDTEVFESAGESA